MSQRLISLTMAAKEAFDALESIEVASARFEDSWVDADGVEARHIRCRDPSSLNFLLVGGDRQQAQALAKHVAAGQKDGTFYTAYGSPQHFVSLTVAGGGITLKTVIYTCQQLATTGRCFAVAPDGSVWPAQPT